MDNYVISINRQFGSLGRPIARIMAETLGIEYYDRDIVDATAKKLNLPVSLISNEEESAKSKFFGMKFPLGNSTSNTQDEIFRIQRNIILDCAEKENCIIVGRCSDYILRSKAKHLNIYIYAPYDKRFDNCVNQLKMNPEEAKKMIAEVDRARDAYHLRYAGYLPSDINHQNLMVDSSILGVERTAKFLIEYIKDYL